MQTDATRTRIEGHAMEAPKGTVRLCVVARREKGCCIDLNWVRIQGLLIKPVNVQ
jgi:hypothetical protein